MILAVVEDLLFLAKIQETARLAGVEIEVADPRQIHGRLSDPGVRAAIFDLNHRSGFAIQVIQAVKSDGAVRHVRIVGFLSHIQGDLAAAARQAGCDLVLARSTFSQRLPQLLRQLADENEPPRSAQA